MPALASRYGSTAIALHWLVAMLLVGQVALGWWMVDIPKEPVGVRTWWFNLHKSLGLVLLALVALRLAWRVSHPAPPLPDSLPVWQRGAAAASHGLLYLLLIVIPLTGYLGSSFSGYPIRFFGTVVPNWGWKWPAAKELMSTVHYAANWVLLVTVALHVAAALSHLRRGDRIFHRMWPTGVSR